MKNRAKIRSRELTFPVAFLESLGINYTSFEVMGEIVFKWYNLKYYKILNTEMMLFDYDNYLKVIVKLEKLQNLKAFRQDYRIYY
jgi:hypothetical protein